MKNKLFEFAGALPEAVSAVTVYSTGQAKEQRERNIKVLGQKLSGVFGIKGRVTDLGDKLQVTQSTKSLSLYRATDSFWYQDDNYFASETRKANQKLPNEKTAREAALNFLRQNDLLLPEASLHSTSYTSVAVNRPKAEKPEEYDTEIHVNFRYALDGIPVFGPGAKTRVSFADSRIKSGVYHFWRNTYAMKRERKLMYPALALEVFCKNFRFRDLRRESAKVTIRKMEQGFYAMSPTDVQNYMIPVYRFEGTVKTEDFPRYDFNHFVVAVKYTDDDVKEMGINTNGHKAMVF